MANLPIEEIEKMVGSRYALTVLAGKRARELRDGAPRLVNSDSNNPIMIALQEIYEGKIVAEQLSATTEEPAGRMSATGEDTADTLGIAVPGDETSTLLAVDLADLTDADAAGIELSGAADITGEPIDDSVPEVASDRLDAVLEMGTGTVSELEDEAIGTDIANGPDVANEEALTDEAAGEAPDTVGIAELLEVPDTVDVADTAEALDTADVPETVESPAAAEVAELSADASEE